MSLPDTPEAYAGFILNGLMQPVAPGGAQRAVAETEAALAGDRWFWADDNAKILEFLALPPLWRQHGRQVGEVFGFLRDLCEGPFILRRTGHPRLEAEERDPARGRFVHSFMTITCDLPKGVVTAGMRFHDGRDARNLVLTGNYVQFTHDGIAHTLDVEDAITGWEVEEADGRLRLLHRSEPRFPHAGGERALGTLTYTYTFDSRSMAIACEAALEIAAGLTVSEVRLTVAQDGLSRPGDHVTYADLHVARPGRPPLHLRPEEAGHRVRDVAGVPYWCLGQREMRGFALGIHTQPLRPERVARLNTVALEPGQWHWLATEYLFEGRHKGGARLVAAERKVIASGGFYDRVSENARLLRTRPGTHLGQPLDLSISYDYGAELVAFSRCVRGLSAPESGLRDPAMLAEARALYDRYLEVYAESLLAPQRVDPVAIFSRPLSFVVMSLVDMVAATGEARYGAVLREAVEALLAFERRQKDVAGGECSTFLMGIHSSNMPYVDCHSAAILALVRAAPLLDDPRIPAAIDRALGAYVVGTQMVEFGGRQKQDLVAVDFLHTDGSRHAPHAFWNFGVALTLRAFAALRRSGDPALAAVAARHAGRMGLMELLMRDQLRRAARTRPDGLEMRTSVLSAEGNSETQPWCALALVAEPGDD